jgi:hypothetical protein
MRPSAADALEVTDGVFAIEEKQLTSCQQE